MVRKLAYALIIACFAAAAGCGQKGPLYLPGDPSRVRTEIPPLPEPPPAGEEGDTGDGEPDADPPGEPPE